MEKTITHTQIDDRVTQFYQKIKPRLTMSELQTIGALSIYLKSGDEKDIPGYKEK